MSVDKIVQRYATEVLIPLLGEGTLFRELAVGLERVLKDEASKERAMPQDLPEETEEILVRKGDIYLTEMSYSIGSQSQIKMKRNTGRAKLLEYFIDHIGETLSTKTLQTELGMKEQSLRNALQVIQRQVNFFSSVYTLKFLEKKRYVLDLKE